MYYMQKSYKISYAITSLSNLNIKQLLLHIKYKIKQKILLKIKNIIIKQSLQKLHWEKNCSNYIIKRIKTLIYYINLSARFQLYDVFYISDLLYFY